MIKGDIAIMPDLPAQKTDTSITVAEHAIGVETATNHKNAKHMANSV